MGNLYWQDLLEKEELEDQLEILTEPSWYDALKHGAIGTFGRKLYHGTPMMYHGMEAQESGGVTDRLDIFGVHKAFDEKFPDQAKSRRMQSLELSQLAYNKSHDVMEGLVDPASDTFDPEYAAWAYAAQNATIEDDGYFDSMVIKKAIAMGLPSMVLAYGGGAIATGLGTLAGGPAAGAYTGMATVAMLTGLMEGGSEFEEAVKYNMDLGMSYEEAAEIASKSAAAYALAAAILEGTLPAGKVFGALRKTNKMSWLNKGLTKINQKVGSKYDDFAGTRFGKPFDMIVAQAATESLEELSQYTAQVLISQGMYRKDTFAEQWDWEEAQMSAYGGLLLGGGMGGGMYGLDMTGIPDRMAHAGAEPTLGKTDLLIKKNKETGFWELQTWDKENNLAHSPDAFNTFREARNARNKMLAGYKALNEIRKKMEEAEATTPIDDKEADGAPVPPTTPPDQKRSTQELLMLEFVGRVGDLAPDELVQLEDYKAELAGQNKTEAQQIEALVESAPHILESLDIPPEEFQGAAEAAGIVVPPAIFEEPQAPITPEAGESEASDMPGPDVGVVAKEPDEGVGQVPVSPEEAPVEVQEEVSEQPTEGPSEPTPVQEELFEPDEGVGPPPEGPTQEVTPPKDTSKLKNIDNEKYNRYKAKLERGEKLNSKEAAEWDMFLQAGFSDVTPKVADAISAEEKLADYLAPVERVQFPPAKSRKEAHAIVDGKRVELTEVQKDQLVKIREGLGSPVKNVRAVAEVAHLKFGRDLIAQEEVPSKKSVLAAQAKKEYVRNIRKVLGLPADEASIPTKGAVSIEAILRGLKAKFGVDYEIINDPTKKWAGRLHRRDDGSYIPQINLAYAKGSDAFHEYTHPIFTLLRKENPALFKQLVDEMMGSKWGPTLLQVVKDNYSEEYDTMDDFMEEALVTALGWFASRVYIQKIKGAKNQKDFVSWVTKVFNVMKEYIDRLLKVSPFGFRVVSPHEMTKITISDIVEWLTNEAIDIDTTPIWHERGFNLIDSKVGINSAHENSALTGNMSDLILYGQKLFKKHDRGEMPAEVMIRDIKGLINYYKDRKLQTKGVKKPRKGLHERFFKDDIAKVRQRMQTIGSRILTLTGKFPRIDFVEKAVEEMLSEDGPGEWYEFYDQLEALNYTYSIVEKMRQQDPNITVDLEQKGLFTSKVQKGEIQLWEEFVSDMLKKGSTSAVELAAIIALNDKVSYDDSLKFIQEFQDPSNKKRSIKVGTLIDLYESWISTKFGIKYVEVSSVASYSGGQYGMSNMANGYGARALGLHDDLVGPRLPLDLKTTRVHLMQDILWRGSSAHGLTGKEGYEFPTPGMGYAWYTFFERDGYSPISVENQSDLWPEILNSLKEYKQAIAEASLEGNPKTKEQALEDILKQAAQKKAWFGLQYILGRAGFDESAISLMSEKPLDYWNDTRIAESIQTALHEVKATNEADLRNMPQVDEDILYQGLIYDVLRSFSGVYNRSTRRYEPGDSIRHSELRTFVANLFKIIRGIKSGRIKIDPVVAQEMKEAVARRAGMDRNKGKRINWSELKIALNMLQESGDIPHVLKVRLAREAHFRGMEAHLGGNPEHSHATGSAAPFVGFLAQFLEMFTISDSQILLAGKLGSPNGKFDMDTMMLHQGVYFESIEAKEREVPGGIFDTEFYSPYKTKGAYINAAANVMDRWRYRTIAEKRKINNEIAQRQQWILALSAHEYDGAAFDLSKDFFLDVVKFVKDDVDRMIKYYIDYVGPAINNTLKEVDPSDPFQDPDYLTLERTFIHFSKGQGAGTHWTRMVEHELQVAKAKGYDEIFFLGNDLIALSQGNSPARILYTTESEVEILQFREWIQKILGSNVDLRDVLSPEFVSVVEKEFSMADGLQQANVQFRMDLRNFVFNNPVGRFVEMEKNNDYFLKWKKDNKGEKGFPKLGIKMAALKSLSNKHGIVIEEVTAADIPMLENIQSDRKASFAYRIDLTTVPDAPLSRMSKLGVNDAKETAIDSDQVLPKSIRPPITPDDPEWNKWFNIIDSNYKRINKFLNRTYLSMELRLWIDEVTDRLPSHLLPVFNKWMQQPHIANILDPDNIIPEFIGGARHNSEIKALNVGEIQDVFDDISDDFQNMMEGETDEEIQVRKNSTFKIRKIAFRALGRMLTQEQMRNLIISSQQHSVEIFLGHDVPRITFITEPTEFQTRMMFRFWLSHNTQETVNQGQAGNQTKDNVIWLFDSGKVQLKGDKDPLYLPGESKGKPNTNDANPSRERAYLISRLYKKTTGALKASLLFLKNKGILGKSDVSAEGGWLGSRIFPRYKKFSAQDLKLLWKDELRIKRIVPISIRGEQGQIIFARVTPEHESMDHVQYWRDQHASGYITKEQANTMSKGTSFEIAANIARFEAVNEIIPGFMVEEVDGVIQPASLLNIFKRLKIPFSPSVFNENMESMNVLILDASKMKFKFGGREHKKGIIKIKGLDPKYIGDGATFASRSTFRKFIDGLGLSPKSNKMKNFIYQKDGDKVLAYKHETFPVEPGMQFFQGTKLVAKVNDKGDIIGVDGNVIDMISTDNEAKIMNGYEYNTLITLEGGSVGLTTYSDKPKQTSTFPLQWFNYVDDADLLNLVKTELINKEKGPLIRRIREAFRTTDNPAKMAAFARKIDNAFPDGISSIVLEKLYLMSGVNPDNQIYLDTMLQKRYVAPTVGMKIGNGYYSHTYPNLRQDLAANEVALAYNDVKNTIIKQYEDETNDDKPTIDKVNKWLENKDIRVLVSRSPITYIGGANYARVARLHTFSGLIEPSSEMVFKRQEGDYDGDGMQVEFIPEALDLKFRQYFYKINAKVTAINIDKYRIDERRYDFSSLDDVFDLMAGVTAGGRAVQEIAAIAAVYGILQQVLETVEIAGIKVRPIPRKQMMKLDHIEKGLEGTPETMIRLYAQAAVDVYNGLLLEKWEYTREDFFMSLFETEDGTPLIDLKGNEFYTSAMQTLIGGIYSQFRLASHIKNGRTWLKRFRLSDVLEKSQQYLEFVNNRQAKMAAVLADDPNAGAVVFKGTPALLEEVAMLPARVYAAGHTRDYHEAGPAVVSHEIAENIHVDVLNEWSRTGFKTHLLEEAIDQSVLHGELPMYNDPNYNARLMAQNTKAIEYARKMANSWYILMGKFSSGLTDTVDYNEPLLTFVDNFHIPFSELSYVSKVLATIYFLESAVGITTTAGKRPRAANSKPPYSTTQGQPTLLDGNVMKEFNILWHKYLYEDDSPAFGSEEPRSRERTSERDTDFTNYTDNGTIMRRFCR